jgi:hypothetical protein
VSPIYRVSGLEKWEGRILEVDDEYFTAELVPEQPSAPTVVADFRRTLLGADDDIEVGDVVYVTTRTVRGLHGYPTLTSAVRLRRLGMWSQQEAEEIAAAAKMRAQDLADFID